MTTLTPAIPRVTLADRLVSRTLASDLVLVLAGAALTGIMAQLAVPIWPVPITGQTLAVLLVGTSLGALRGAFSMIAYLLLGVAGVPWFSDATHGWAVIAGPTGGYIVGFIAAAALTGLLAQRSWDKRVLGAALSFVAGSVVVFLVGLPWLAVALHLDLAQTLAFGLYPFIIGGIVKAAIGAGLIWGAWRVISARAS
ncbi:MAG: biotin transporter BioY [Microbacteriaceae bacterium]|nr:biotin transporter BioY [Microbacteriaceae bacterium]